MAAPPKVANPSNDFQTAGAAPFVASTSGSYLSGPQRSCLSASSILHIILGISTIIIQFLIINQENANLLFPVIGILLGICFIASGIIGLISAASNKYGMMIATMVMSIISSVVVSCLFAISGNRLYYCFVDSQIQSLEQSSCRLPILTCHVVVVLIVILEFINSIWMSVQCCKGVCQCCSSDQKSLSDIQGQPTVSAPGRCDDVSMNTQAAGHHPLTTAAAERGHGSRLSTFAEQHSAILDPGGGQVHAPDKQHLDVKTPYGSSLQVHGGTGRPHELGENLKSPSTGSYVYSSSRSHASTESARHKSHLQSKISSSTRSHRQ